MTRSIALLIFAVSVAAAACVSLDKPQSVVACEKSHSCTDSTSPVQNGGAGGQISATGGTGGASTSATGGAPGSGGGATTAVGSGGTAGAATSTARGSGGIATGGTVGTDPLGAGGSVGPGGVDGGASAGTGGLAGAGGGGDTGLDSALPDTPIGSGGAVASSGGSATGGTVGTGGLPGSGGVISSGGVEAGTGGTTTTGGTTATGGAATYNCSAALSPASGLVTDFSNWNATTSLWTSGSLTGNAYRYGSSSATTTVKVEGTPAGLHLTGSIPSSNYGGAGLTFLSCVTATAFTKMTFEVYGSATNCAIELQLQTYEQRPADQTPPGGCKADGGSSCFKFPAASQVVNLGTAVAAPGTTVSVTLSSMTNWTSAAAGQIVGIQWQFTPSGGTCTPNATFTNVKFVP